MPNTVVMDYSHAPSLDWIDYAGWSVETEPFEYGDPANLRVGEDATNVHPETPVTLEKMHLNANERGVVYRVSAEVRAGTAEEIVDISFVVLDELISNSNSESLYISYPLISADQLGDDWVAVSGEFEFWGSSGLQLQIRSDAGQFMHRNLRLERVGPGSLEGNPIIPQTNQIDPTGELPDLSEFLEDGWRIKSNELAAAQASALGVALQTQEGASVVPDFAASCEGTLSAATLHLANIRIEPEETYRVRAEVGAYPTTADATAFLLVNATELPQAPGTNAAYLTKVVAHTPVSESETTTVLEGVFSASTLREFRFYLLMEGGELDLNAISIHKVEEVEPE